MVVVLGLGSGSGVWNRVQVLCVFGIGFRCSESGSSIIISSISSIISIGVGESIGPTTG